MAYKKSTYVFDVYFDGEILPPINEVVNSINDTMENTFGINSKLEIELPLMSMKVKTDKLLTDDEVSLIKKTIKDNYSELLPQYKILQVKLNIDKSRNIIEPL